MNVISVDIIPSRNHLHSILSCDNAMCLNLGRASVIAFTKEGVNVFKEEDVLITCKGEPILIEVRDSHGRYRIPLMQQRGQWQPQRPSKQARKALRQANSISDLQSTEQAIKWMHAVCGYPENKRSSKPSKQATMWAGQF